MKLGHDSIQRMDMQIVHTRHGHSAAEVGHPGSRSDKVRDVIAVTYGHESSCANRYCLHPFRRSVHGVDTAVDVHRIGRLCWCCLKLLQGKHHACDGGDNATPLERATQHRLARDSLGGHGDDLQVTWSGRT